MVWEKNPSWWATAALNLNVAPKYVVDIVNSSNNAALGELISGGLDLDNNYLPGIAQVVNGGYGVTTYFAAAPYMLSGNTAWLVPNTLKKPLDDPKFRKALAESINVNDIVTKDYGNVVAAANPTGLLPVWSKYIDAAQVTSLGFKYDVAQAKALLAKAGHPNGFDVTLNHLAGYATYLDRFAELLKTQLAQAGIRVNIQANQNAVWLDKQNRADYELMDNEYAYQADPLFYLMPRPGRQGPTPPEMAALITKAQSGSADDYLANLQKVAVMQDDLVYPDITIAARHAWVSYGSKVVSAAPDATLSRTFLANVALK